MDPDTLLGFPVVTDQTIRTAVPTFGTPYRLSAANELPTPDIAALVKAYMPYILAELRALAPAMARAIAGEAAESRPLDGVSLAALADWLRDQRFDGLADQVAAMRPGGKDVLILKAHGHLMPTELATIRDNARSMGVTCVVLPYDLDLVGITSKE